jgi:hypothetical protein
MLPHVTGAVCAVNVAIDEARQNRAASRVKTGGIGRNCYIFLRTRSDYSPVLDDDNAGADRLATKPVYQGTTDNRRQHSQAFVTDLKG